MEKVDVYLHSNKEEMWDQGEKIGLKGEALRKFKFACYEVKITLNVNEDTGDASIVAVDDRTLAE